MDDVLQALEGRINKLVQQYEHLKSAHVKLTREKELLISKHKITITQIESMVSRLKAIERPL